VPDDKSYEYLANVALDRQAYVIDQADKIDIKVGTVLSSGTLILPITAALIVDWQNPEPIPCEVKTLITLAAAAYAVLFYFFFRAFRTKVWKLFPPMSQLNELAFHKTIQEVHDEIIQGCSVGHLDNFEALKFKGAALKTAVVCLGAEVACLTVAVLWLLFI